VMREIGIDLGEHRSRGVTPADARTSDLVVAMAHDHLAWLALHYPDAGGERVLVRAFDAGPQPAIDADDLPDPIGRSLRFYRQQRDRLVRALDHLALHLKHHG